MTRTRIAYTGAALALAAIAVLFGGVFRSSASTQPQVRIPADAASQLERGFALGDTQGLIRSLQNRLQRNGRDAKAYATLGLAYQQRARETGDPSYYPKAEGTLRRALSLHPNDLIATAGLGQLALSRHRFGAALAQGEKARAISPSTAGVYGVIGDANLELGRYDAAFQAFDRMAALKPSVASYARVSYARELLGKVQPAVTAMQLAVDAAGGEREASAWTHVQLGTGIYLATGRVHQALVENRAALQIFPSYYLALDGMAQTEAALGHYRTAIRFEQAAVDRIPLPQFVGFLGDLYRVTGQEGKAHEQYALIGAIQRLLVANGVRNDIDIALFQVDHGIQPSRALTLARRGHAERPSVYGDDVLAWALERNGRCGEALHYSQRALRLGSLNALAFFHRGEIERCLGHGAAARTWFGRALALNPHFSVLWAPVARKAVA